jgi:serine/threonine protein kinase
MHVPQTEVILRHDGAELARVTLPPGEYVIGRNPDVQIHADTPLISRRHAQLTINYDHLLIEDLGSSNGTFVGEQRINEATRLFPNQAVRLGDVTVELRRERASSEPGVSLAPAQAAIRRFLPEEILAEKRYAIGTELARGGMGAILDARQNATQRTVAMKVMLGSGDEADVLRFIEEAQVTAQLDHPNIVPIYELGVDEQDQLFYTMKLVRGITLKKVLELLAEGVEATAKKYPLPALLTIFQKVCDAVAFAHAKSVIHRDLKPENIMLGDFGSVLVMDWGLAKVIRRRAIASSANAATLHSMVASARAGEGEFGSTMTGTIMGTPQYMAPEQARGEVETLDPRADIYALGAILFEILHLRPTVTGEDIMDVVGKVERGEIAWDAKRNARVPDGLLAVCRQALAFDKTQRYPRVEDLQRDLTAYQTGFATSAEKAGAWKQITLLIKRHKAVAAGLAAVFVVGTTLGTKAVLEGRRANRALADLKRSAPALLQLAESEADSQRFPSALEKLDAALALDPALLRAWWQRAWVLLALERWSEAADALRLAPQHDPAGAQFASILSAVETIAAAPEAERWKSDATRQVFQHLQSVEASGPALAFSTKLKLGAAERLKLADQRLLAALGKGNYKLAVENDGLVSVNITNRPLRSLEAIRGLPIESLDASYTPITDLEPLRGMQFQVLNIEACKAITDLTPLRGMPLRSLTFRLVPIRDLTPLAGMRLTRLDAKDSQVADISPLTGMPLFELHLDSTRVSRIEVLRGMPLTKLWLPSSVLDCSPLKGAPLQFLAINGMHISDLSFAKGMPLRSLHAGQSTVSNIDGLRGMPLEFLTLFKTPITDLTALHGAPLNELDLRGCKQLTDYTPVLTLPRLERLHLDVLPAALLPLRESATLQSIEADAYPGEGAQGARPVAEFWAAYDAQ